MKGQVMGTRIWQIAAALVGLGCALSYQQVLACQASKCQSDALKYIRDDGALPRRLAVGITDNTGMVEAEELLAFIKRCGCWNFNSDFAWSKNVAPYISRIEAGANKFAGANVAVGVSSENQTVARAADAESPGIGAKGIAALNAYHDGQYLKAKELAESFCPAKPSYVATKRLCQALQQRDTELGLSGFTAKGWSGDLQKLQAILRAPSDTNLVEAKGLVDTMKNQYAPLKKNAALDKEVQNFETKVIHLRQQALEKAKRDKLEAARAQEEARAKAAVDAAAAAQQAKVQSKIQADRDRKARSPECEVAQMRVDYCEKLVSIRMMEMVIAHEEAVGKESGFVNAKTIHTNVSNKAIVQGEAKALAGSIAQHPGRGPASTTNCGVQDQPPFGASFSKTILSAKVQACGD
jgi:hypothetical protein